MSLGATPESPLSHIRRPATAAAGGGAPAISASELRAGMQQHLRSSGALKTLKTQLRGMVLTELMHNQKRVQGGRSVGTGIGESISLEDFEARRRGGGGGGVKPSPSARARDAGINDSNIKSGSSSSADTAQGDDNAASPSSFSSWSACVADALIENHLRRTSRPMSLSIFATEAEVAPLSDTGAPSDEERSLRHLLLLTPPAGAGGNEASGLSDDLDGDVTAAGSPMPSTAQKSLLQQLVEAQLLSRDSIQKHYAAHRHNCGTQTYEADKKGGNEKNTLLSLECRLAAVDAKYSLSYSQVSRNSDGSGGGGFFTRAEVDRRLQHHKQEVHDQLRAEYEHKLKHYEATKLQDGKDSLEARYQLLDKNRMEELAEMQRTLTVKADQERERLREARLDLERRAGELDRRQREVHAVVHDHEVQLTDHEATLSALKDKLRVAQLQCARWEELSSARLMEIDATRARERRRTEDLQRTQAEHAAEMRIKEEELARLRFRLRMALNNTDGTATGGIGITGQAGSAERGPQDKVSEDLYRMLVRTEELQRTAVDQQRQVQRQQECSLEERIQHQHQQLWGARGGTTTGWNPSAAVQPAAVEPATTASPMVPAAAVHIATAAEAIAAPEPVPKKGPEVAIAAAIPIPTAAEQPSPVPARTAGSYSPFGSSSSSSLVHTPRGNCKRPSPGSSPIAAQPITASIPSSSDSNKTSSSSAAAPQQQQQQLSAKGSSTSSKSTARASSKASTHSNSNEAVKKGAAELTGEEQTEREDVTEQEDSDRKGIEWAARNQHEVIVARGGDLRRNNSSTDSSNSSGGGGGGRQRRGGAQTGFMDRLAQQRREQEAEEAAANNVIYRDDTDDDDSILFGNKGSGSEDEF